tara:strand:- start:54 stop:935 length:882 start_codon:yes stop_codon:yes gene_type:complete
MKLNKLGKLYKVNSENKFINDKDKNKDFSKLLTNLIDICLEYIQYDISSNDLYQSRNIDYSVYIRGSCLELDVNDKNILDLDIIVVIEDSQKISYSISSYYKEKIINKMNKLYGFSIHPDITYFSKSLWLGSPIMRFLSKKIKGREDLSTTSLGINEALLQQQNGLKRNYNLILDNIKKVNKYNIQWIIKLFYRSFGGLELLKNGMFSRSIYYCHNALMKKYPQHLDSLEEILYLFLNPKKCNNLDKFEETVRSIYNNINQRPNIPHHKEPTDPLSEPFCNNFSYYLNDVKQN